MKKLLILILFFPLLCGGQNKDKFTLFILTEPQHFFDLKIPNWDINWKGDGFNIGAGIDYQMPELIYFKAQTYFFPNLNGKDYLDIEGAVGIHYRNWLDTIRLYTGIKGGFIYREGPHGKFGIEAGVEYYINNIFFGIQPSYNLRADGGVWGKNEKNYWGFDTSLKIGIIL